MSKKNLKNVVHKASLYNKENKYNETISLVEPYIYDKDGNITDSPHLLDVLGRAYLGEKRGENAIDLLVEFYEENPYDSYINTTLVRAYMMVNDPTSAIDVLDNMVANDPNHSWAAAKLHEVTGKSVEMQKQTSFDPPVYEY